MKPCNRNALSAAALIVSVTAAWGAGPALAAGAPAPAEDKRTVMLQAQLTPVNGSGTTGRVRVLLRGTTITRIKIAVGGVAPDGPHPLGVYVGADALRACPSLGQDANGDGRISLPEGGAAYGSVVAALTTAGDTLPESLLALDRVPTSDAGRLTYVRRNISLPGEIVDALRTGQGVIVLSGVDHDGNGVYSASDLAGVSDVDPSLPAELTDPAACGVLR